MKRYPLLLLALGILLTTAALAQSPPSRSRAKGQSARRPPAAPRPLHWQPLREPGSGGWITSFSISPHDGKRMLVGGDMLGIGLSEDGGRTYQATFGLKSYEIGDFTWHPSDPKTVWAGTMSGPYLSRNGGRNWTERRNGFPPLSGGHYSAPVEKVLFDPTDSRHLLAFGGSSRRWNSPGQPAWGAVWESRDGGESWTRKAELGKNIVSAAWAAGFPNRLLIALDGAGIHRSEDAGKTWEKASNGLPHDKVERGFAHPKDPDTFWVSLENHKPQGAAQTIPGGVFKTTDGGDTWQDISDGLSRKRHENPNFTARYKAFAVSMSSPDVMYAADSAWDTGVIYGTKDGGRTWKAQATRGNVGNDDRDPARAAPSQVRTAYFAGIGGTVMAVDPKNPNVAYCLGSEHLIGTKDGGRTWRDEGNDPAPNGGWRGRGFSGLCCVNFVFNPNRPGDALLLGMDAGKLWRSRDDLKTWSYHGEKPGPWGGGVDGAFAGSHIYATAGQFGEFLGILHSADDGKTWEVQAGPERGLPAAHDRGAQPSAIYARPDVPNEAYVLIEGKLYATNDAGAKWQMVQENLSLNWLAGGDPANPKRLYLSGKDGVFVSDDGVTVKSIGGPKPATRIRLDKRGRLYATSWRQGRGGVWRWDGKGWTRLFDNGFVHDVAADPKDPTRLAAATHDHPYHDATYATGVYVSADDGKTWRQANDGLPVLRGESVTFDPHRAGRMVFGSHGRGFFVAEWPKGYLPKTEAKQYRHTAEDTAHAAAYSAQ